ncbi:MAG: DEAD/DEAH box helicase [Candidatus Aenigmarchaeota archaeon]|nr:DEAD/DEAH box helicase [Candidatus Aenigmarchaeota archaeon]
MKEFVKYPLLKKNTLEKRLYQETVFATASQKNTMVVLPTGLGKTATAILLAAHRLNKVGGRVMVLAPTRPLVEQHKKTFAKFMEIEEDDMKVFTGKIPPAQREKEYKKATIVFATPQVIQNDLIAGRVDFSDYSLLVLDECHRGVKDYPYPFIAEMYTKKAKNPRILGLTASPGATKERIDQVCKNLYLDAVEIRTEFDADVRPYVQKVNMEWKMIELPKEFKEVHKLIRNSLKKRYQRLKAMELTTTVDLKKRDLLQIQGRIRSILATKPKPPPWIYQGLSTVAEAIKIEHALELLETQGSGSLLEYFKRMQKDSEKGKTKAVKRVMKDPDIEMAFLKTYELVGKGIEHPKLDELYKTVELQLKEYPKSKIIVFSQYRDTVKKIVEVLKGVDRCRPIAFIGQAGEDGLTQKEQIKILNEFKNLKYNTIVATSVGEEGLDIPSVDLVVFYEPIPSEIRSIQRRGRTGRHSQGKVVVLIAKETRDEAYFWVSRHKEKKMKVILKNMRDYYEEKQRDLSEFNT